MTEPHKQVAAQCKVVAHLATAIAQVHSDKAEMMAANAMPTIVDLVGRNTASIMETLGDILNGMDAVEEGDEWTDQVFEEAHRLFPQPEEVTIPRARLEALEAAVLKWLSENEALSEAPPDCECKNCRIYKALRSAGLQTEGEGK